MSRIFISFVFVFSALGLSIGANAVSISAEAVGQLNSTKAGVTNINFESGTCAGYASCSGNYLIVGNSVSGEYAAPYTDTTKYLTVGPYGSGNTATFKLGGKSDYFGLFWGSIDGYNAISFLLGATQVASYTGAALPSLTANGGQTQWASNRYINFDFGSLAFDTVVLTSTSKAFESDNHAFRKASVSEPMTLVLMGLGLFGLMAARRFKRA